MDIYSCGTAIVRELYKRINEFNGGNSGNTVGYITFSHTSTRITLDVGMNLVSRSYASTVESQLRRTISSVVASLGVPYSVGLDFGFVAD